MSDNPESVYDDDPFVSDSYLRYNEGDAVSDDLTQRIAEVLQEHRFRLETFAVPACTCGQWSDSGPSPKRVQHNYEEHVAEAVVAALQLTEEQRHGVYAPPERRLVGPWREVRQ